MENRIGRQEQELVMDHYQGAVTAALSMTVRDFVVKAVSSGSAYQITLPPVRECMGKIYYIEAVTVDGSITVAHYGDSERWIDAILDTTGDRILLFSTGESWVAIGGLFTNGPIA